MSNKIEVGVLRALKAYKIESGLSDKAAEAWATANLNAGVARFNAVLAPYRGKGDEAGHRAAFADIKKWAQSS